MKIPEHLFVSTDGALYDTRAPNWHSNPPLRPQYRGVFHGNTIGELKAALRQRCAWPGGYPLVFVADDGALLCADCVRREFRRIADSMRHACSDGWRIVAVSYEAVSPDCADPETVSECAHCYKLIGELGC